MCGRAGQPCSSAAGSLVCTGWQVCSLPRQPPPVETSGSMSIIASGSSPRVRADSRLGAARRSALGPRLDSPASSSSPCWWASPAHRPARICVTLPLMVHATMVDPDRSGATAPSAPTAPTAVLECRRPRRRHPHHRRRRRRPRPRRRHPGRRGPRRRRRLRRPLSRRPLRRRPLRRPCRRRPCRRRPRRSRIRRGPRR